MSALTSYRVFQRVAAGFDGTTAETATYTQLRHVFSTATTSVVGRFSPESLNRYNVVSLMRISLQGVLAPGDVIRVRDSAGEIRFTRPASLDSSGFFLVLPDDQVDILALGATAADIIVDDLTDPQLIQWAQAEAALNGGGEVLPPGQSSITVTETQQLPAFAGHLIVFVNPTVADIDITLPAIGDILLDARITFVRIPVGGGPVFVPRIIADDAFDKINGIAGITDGEYFLRSFGDSTTYVRIPDGWARRQGFEAPQRISSTANPVVVPPWTEGTLFVNDANGAQGTVVQLPPIIDCREGCRLVLSAAPTILIEAVVHALTPSGGDTVNGSASFLFTAEQASSIVTVELTGGQWRAVSNNADLITGSNPITTAPGALAPHGGQAIERVVLAVDGDVVLPDPDDLPIGSSVTVVRTGGAGTPRIITNAAGTAVNGVTGTAATAYYLRSIGDSISYRMSATGWTRPQGTGAPAPIVSASNVVIPDYVRGEVFVRTTGGGGQSVTLPDATTVAVGTKVYMVNSGAAAHSLAAFAGQTILGAAVGVIPANSGFVVYCDGTTNWKGWATP